MTPTHCTRRVPYRLEEIEEALAPLPLPNPKFLTAFLVGLLTCQKALFAKIAHAMPGDATPESQQMRIRRYLDLPFGRLGPLFARTLVALLPHPAPWVLALDRTNWKRGKTEINLLVLAVVIGKIAVPVLWCRLHHPGNSDTPERIALLGQFLTLFGSGCVRLITADREFIGADWLAWLDKQELPFLIRIRKDDLLTRADGTCQEAWLYFRERSDACRNKKHGWDLWGTCVHVGGKRLPRGEFLIVVSNRPAPDLLSLYRLRWGIETCFQAMKGRGFDLERCCTPRVESFFGLLSLCLLWCLRAGLSLEEMEPSKPLKHGRLARSWFRRGLDYLHRVLAPLAGRENRSAFERVRMLLRQGCLPAKICL